MPTLGGEGRIVAMGGAHMGAEARISESGARRRRLIRASSSRLRLRGRHMQLALPLPRRDFTLTVFLIAFATLLAFVSTAQAAAELGYGGEPIPWIGLLRARVVDWYLCFLFLPALWWLAKARPIGRSGWATALPLHFAASLGCALAKESLYVLVGNWFRPGVFRLPEILAGDYFDEVLLFWAMIGLIHAFRAHGAAAPRGARSDARPVAAVDRFV